MNEESNIRMRHASPSFARAQIAARDLTLARAGTALILGLDLALDRDSRVAIVGENGRGKSTLLNALAGSADAGELLGGSVHRQGRIAFGAQDLPAHDGRTVGDALAFAIRDSLDCLAELDRAGEALASGRNGSESSAAEQRYASALDAAVSLDAWDAERRVTIALEALGAETDREYPLSRLSVGQRYRVRLACLLGGDAELLLLDEPSNHLDAEALAFLTERLRNRAGGFAIVSHDRQLLRDVAATFVDLDPSPDGRPRVFGGGYEAWLAARKAERARWEQQYQEQLETERRLRDELEAARDRLVDGWRPPKGTGKHQRATRASSLVANVKRRQQLLEARTVEIPEPPLGLSAPDWRVRLRGAVLSAEGVALPGRLSGPVSLSLRAGDRLLVRGPNGAGKSTLLSILAGRLEPGGGRVLRRDAARVSLLAQESELASGALAGRSAASLYRERAAELVARGVLPESRSVPLEQLGLLGSSERARPVGTLSLGQRRRLDLALCLLEQPDVLLLDEPSNHLSIALVDELTEALAALPCAVAVSTHDRGMLNDLAEWPALELSRLP